MNQDLTGEKNSKAMYYVERVSERIESVRKLLEHEIEVEKQMEMQFQINNIEQLKQKLSQLKGQLKGKQAGLELMSVIQNGSGQVCTEMNEIYRMLIQVENALYDLIDTTETVVGNTKETVQNTDNGFAASYNQANENPLLQGMLKPKDFSKRE